MRRMPFPSLASILVLCLAARAEDIATADPFVEGMKALRAKDLDGAIRHLGAVPEESSNFSRAMITLGQEVYGRLREEPEKGVPYLERAYGKAHDDMEVVKAYIDILVLSGKAFPTARPERAHAAEPKPEFKALTSDFEHLASSPKIAKAKLEEDLDFLELRLEHCYSYTERRGIDYKGALDAVRASLADETPLAVFALRTSMLFCLFGDAHTKFNIAVGSLLPRGYAPFTAGSHQGRVFIHSPGRNAFIDSECPFLVKMDGVPIEKWLQASNPIIPQGSPHFVHDKQLESLLFINYLRQGLGLSVKEEVQLDLESPDRKQSRSMTVKVEATPIRRKGFTYMDTGRVGEFGYLRIPSMRYEPAFLEDLNERMEGFKDTSGLIIDVRDNSGGSQDTLKTLLPYFLKPEDPMRIVNVAAYRLPVKLPRPNPAGFLGLHGRSLHPPTSKVWSPDEREQIHGFLESFRPSWTLPAGKFSDWHVMAVHPRSNPRAYRYEAHVCVLSNAGSFSATDNFLGGLKGLPNVTLVGTPSGGGSGRMQYYKMPNSKLPFTLSQMASYSRTGVLYDSNGVAPDVIVEAMPEDHIGKGDAVLDAALKILREKKNAP